MPLLPALPPSGWPRLCLAGLLALASLPATAQSPAAGAAPAASPHADKVAECLQKRRDEPNTAVTLAEALLATPRLPVEDELKTLSCLGIAAAILGDAARAADAAARMESRVAEHPRLPADFRLRAYSQAGSIYHSAGQIHRAEAAYLRAHDLSQQLDARESALTQAATLTNLGLIHADYLDSPEVADGYYRRALAAADSVGLNDPLIFYNHALNLLVLGKRDEALAMMDRAEAADRQRGGRLVVERMRSERAGLLVREGRLDEARRLLEQALASQRALPDPTGEAGTLARLSTLQRLNGQPAAALQTARLAWARVEQAHEPRKQRDVLLAWMAAHAALGQADEALAVGQRLHRLEMDALKQQRLELLADLQARSESATAQRELEQMRHEAQIRSLNDEKARLLRRAGMALLGLLVVVGAAFGLLQRRKNRQLRAVSATDPLTGLKNRRAATRALQNMALQRGSAQARHVLFLIDIDHFKQVNDSHGHHAGDLVLSGLARRLQDACRPGDLVARWGGEEFLVACPDLEPAQARAVAVRLHQAMGCTMEVAPGSTWSLTASLGFAPFPFFEGGEPGWDYALRMADRALYAAKDRRNAWTGLWGGLPPPGQSAEAVLENPQAAIQSGVIDLMTSQPRASASVAAA